MRKFLFLLFLISPFFVLAKTDKLPINHYEKEFAFAYNQFPDVPRGLLEAVSFTMTRFHHNQNTTESCVGLPKTYGVMGLTLDGKNYFQNNLLYISQLSGISVNDIIQSPQQSILAYAAAYHHELILLSPFQYQEKNIAHIISKLSELPSDGLQQNFALNSHLYSVVSFMNNVEMQQAYQFPSYNFDLEKVFGVDNLKVLSSKKITISNKHIEGDEGETYKKGMNNKSVDYPPAITDLTTCNFSSRNSTAISAVTIHTVQGTYSSCISWFKNCTANVSAHYVLRSVDGQVTQMVLESDKGWHVGSENPYTIGLEHEGFVNDSSWYTAAMYQSSAALVTDITQSGYGINPLRIAYFPWTATTNYNVTSTPGSCIKVKGHQHYPNQSHTDPGANWDWDYYYKLINDPTSVTTVNTNQTGTITDLGGAGNYTNDERTLFLIQPTNAVGITLTVNQFDVEPNWDYLYIYEGTTVFDSLIGRFDGTSIPPTINVGSGSVLVEFRSDCATIGPGYDISWTSSIITDVGMVDETFMNIYPNPAKEQITIDFITAQTGRLIINDITGRLMLQKELNHIKQLSVPIAEFSKGIYFINYQNKVVKFVKK